MAKGYELKPKEIQYIISEGVIKYTRLDIPRRRQAIDNDIAHAAQKKLLEYLIAKINECEERVTLGTLKDMLKEIENNV